MSPEQELVLCCARTHVCAATADRIRSLASSEIDWLAIVETASGHGVLPLLELNLRLADGHVPQSTALALREQLRLNGVLNLQAVAEVQQVTSLLGSNGIPCACLKGPALAISAYGNINLRQFGDLDILVRKQDLDRAIELLRAAGYSLDKPLRETSEDYHAQMIAPNHPRMLELHWALSGLFFGFDLGEPIWERLRRLSLGESTFYALPAEEELLFLAVHGAKHNWSRLVWISDVAEHTRAHPELDWPRLLALARKLGYDHMLLLGLKLAADLLGSTFPKSVQREMAATPRLDSLAAEVTGVLFGAAPGFVVEARLRSDLFNLAVHRGILDRARYCLQLLSPTEKDTALVSLPAFLRGLHYLIRPLRLTAVYGPQLVEALLFRRIARRRNNRS